MQYKDPYIEICIEGPFSVFRSLSQNDKELLDQNHSVSSYRKGNIIITEGARQRGIICLVSGKAKIFSIGAGGREQIIKMLRPQNLVNYRSLFQDTAYPFSVGAVEDSTAVVFEKNLLSRILKENTDFAVKIMKVMSEDLGDSYDRMVSLTQKHVRGRLAESILLLRDTYGLDADGKTIRVHLSREDIAHLSNMTTSNAIRTLSNLAGEQIIDIDGRKISILNVQKLEEISESGQ